MTSSSNDRPPFFTADRGSIVRLAVVVALGAAALVGQVVLTTSAQFRDEKQISVKLSVPPGPTPTPTATP